MKTIFTLALALFTTFTFADSHTIVKQNGEKIEANYVTTKDNTIFYSFPGSSTINEISIFAVDKVIEKATNTVVIDNKKLDVSGKSGYKNVQILDKNQTQGLQQGAALTTTIHKPKGQLKSDWIAQATTTLKKKAAEKGLAFVVITKKSDSKLEALAYTY